MLAWQKENLDKAVENLEVGNGWLAIRVGREELLVSYEERSIAGMSLKVEELRNMSLIPDVHCDSISLAQGSFQTEMPPPRSSIVFGVRQCQSTKDTQHLARKLQHDKFNTFGLLSRKGVWKGANIVSC